MEILIFTYKSRGGFSRKPSSHNQEGFTWLELITEIEWLQSLSIRCKAMTLKVMFCLDLDSIERPSGCPPPVGKQARHPVTGHGLSRFRKKEEKNSLQEGM